jgi:predicted exporter
MKTGSFSEAIFRLWERTRRFHLPAWILFHVILFGVFLLTTPIRVDSDLFSILPDSNPSRAVSHADRKLSAALNGGFSVLVGHRDFAAAKKAAFEITEEIKGHPSVERVSLEVDPSLLASFRTLLFENRYRSLAPETLKELEAGDAERMAAEAFQVVSSPLSVGALDGIERDPFLLSYRTLQWYLGSGLLNNLAVGPRDGVLAASLDGVWYVLINVQLREGGLSTRTKGHIVPALYSLAGRIKERTPGLELVYSGVPFHTYESASRAQTEIAVISAAATGILVAVVVLLFLSLMPLAATFLTMGMGIAAGMAGTFLCFREVHLFTVVFGTSLIGISVDYAVVFFAEWMNPAESREGPAIIRRILYGITIGLATTLLSYIVLLAAPFPLLRQMAVFSSVGLLSTFLSVIFVFPRFRPPRLPRKNIPILVLNGVLSVYDRFFALRSWVRWGLLGLCVLAAAGGLLRVHTDNDVRSFYRMSPRLIASEARAAKILNLGTSGAYYIVRGADMEDTLRREEALTARLEQGVAEGRLGGFIATTSMLPSRERQDHAYGLVGSVLMPRAGAQMEALGFDAASLEALRRDYRAQAGVHLDSSRFFSLPFSGMTRSLWIGEVDGQTFSAVLLLRVHDKGWLPAPAAGLPGVTLVNKIEDVGRTLQQLSAIALLLIAAAYILIFLGMWRLYDLPTAVKVSAVPVAASILTVAILGYAGLPLNLFAIVGLILVPGIGSDYAVFYEEGHTRRAVTMLAVTLSLVSTVSSFGALAFSSLAGVFGLTVSLGVIISFLLSPLAARRLHGGRGGREAAPPRAGA